MIEHAGRAKADISLPDRMLRFTFATDWHPCQIDVDVPTLSWSHTCCCEHDEDLVAIGPTLLESHVLRKSKDAHVCSSHETEQFQDLRSLTQQTLLTGTEIWQIDNTAVVRGRP